MPDLILKQSPFMKPASTDQNQTANAALPVRPDTPCVAVCSTTFDEICRGCGRTVVEVATWVTLDEAAREIVWQRILAQGYPRRKG